MSSMTTSLQFWMSGVNNAPSIKTFNRMEPIILKLYNFDWVMRLQAWISTIMDEWFLQWLQNYHFNELSQQCYQYQHSWKSEATHILKSRILNEWSRQWSQHPDSLRNSIILTELEDYRHEYLGLWMSDVFNDNKIPFWMSGVNMIPV